MVVTRSTRTFRSLAAAATAIPVLGLFLCGCGASDKAAPVPGSASEAEEQLRAAFEDFQDPAVQKKIQTFSQALEASHYEAAYQGLFELGQTQATSLDQVVAVENSDRLLQRRVLEGVEQGDPAAIRTWEFIKAGRRR